MIILNNSPVIHRTVALGGLDALPALYSWVLGPKPVLRELEALQDLGEDPRRVGVRPVPAIRPGYFVYHFKFSKPSVNGGKA